MTLSNCIGLLLKWTHQKSSIYKGQLLTVLLQFIVTVYLILPVTTHLPPPQNTFFLLKFNVITFH